MQLRGVGGEVSASAEGWEVGVGGDGREEGLRAPALPRWPHSHGRDLEELLEQLRALARGLAQQHLGGHPVRDLAAALQQQLQVGSLPAAALPVEHIVHEFQLHPRRRGEGAAGRGEGVAGRRQRQEGQGREGWKIEKAGTRQDATDMGKEGSNINNTLPSTERFLGARPLNHLVDIIVTAFIPFFNREYFKGTNHVTRLDPPY